MIEQLTAEQEARFPEFVQKWTDIGLCTEPADKERAERGIQKAYAIAGLSCPKIIWCKSPLGNALACHVLKSVWASIRDSVSDSVRNSIRNSVWDSVVDSVSASVSASVSDSVSASVSASVWDSVSASVVDSVSASVWDSVSASIRDSVSASIRDSVSASIRNSVSASIRDSVWASVRDSVRDSVVDSVRDSVRDSIIDSISASVSASVRASVSASVVDSVSASVWDSVSASVVDSISASVWASIRASVRDSIRNSVWASIRNSVWASVRGSGYGQHDGWLSFYDYFCIVCGLKRETEKLQGLIEIAKSANWFLPYKDVCFISERHHVLHRDENGRLHADGEMALQYPDGWGIYSWHGTRLPEKYGNQKSKNWDIDWIAKEDNAEYRRVLLEGIGAERLWSLCEKHSSWREYTLYQSSQLAPNTNLQYLKMICPSTGKTHVLRVPPDIETARQAATWVNHGIDPMEFETEA